MQLDALGTILVQQRLLTDDQLATAVVEQERSGQRLDHVLVRLGMVSETQVLEAIGEQFAMPVVDLQSCEVAIKPIEVPKTPAIRANSK